ncbi:MAG TPA: methyltransferase domain-containing protein [Steroidobacteraceae bacterium]|nr:methyltransferase domain-containing protein [Steroidobacteraceae bacterium]
MSGAGEPSAEHCRLCGGALAKRFDHLVLGRHRIDYLRCEACGSLQTEMPYWLTEAYDSPLAAIDTGAVERCLRCQAAIVATARIFGLRGRVLDFGGGAGLLCRLLRDAGLDAWLCDKYAEPVYAPAFALPLSALHPGGIALLSAIEVFEHCADPASELGALFDLRPDVLFASTEPYRGEGASWWYLNASAGQHVFFYTTQALVLLAQRHEYHYFGAGSFHVYSRSPPSPLQHALLRLALSRRGIRLMRLWLAMRQDNRFAQADYDRLTR